MTIEKPTNHENEERIVETPELLDIMEVLESQTPEQLKHHKLRMLDQISDREMIVRMINDTLDGYGAL